jgi:predicted ATP-binding protein involved in virulence
MKITKVTLQNFRGIGSLELDFPIDQNIIALVGVNGVGKSSILDAITKLLFATLDAKKYFGIDMLKRDTFVFEKSDIRISKEDTSCNITLSNADKKYSIKVHREDTRCDYVSSQGILTEMPNNLLLIFPSDRKMLRIYAKDLSNPTPSKNPRIGGFIHFDELLDWFRSIEDIENEERLENNGDYRDRNLEAVRKAISSVLGNDFGRIRVRRSTNDLIINKNGIDISINWLSDGEKSLIALVSNIAIEIGNIYPITENLLEGAGIILIDEIELHMHPTWQRMIIPQLTKTFPNCQFIVTTHSPQVLSHVQPESIYLLKKVGEDIVVTKPQYSYGRDSNRILEDLMDGKERPAEIQDQLEELFSLIHQGHLSEAQQLVEQLSETIGASEPELGKAEVMIKRREIIGR